MELEVMRILQMFWRWRWSMLAVVATTMCALVLAKMIAEPEYQTAVKLQVTTPEQENVVLFDEPRFASEREAIEIARNNFQIVVESDQVRSATIKELGLEDADQNYKLDVELTDDADFLDIVITARSPTLTADIANTHAQAAIQRMGELSALRSYEAKNYLANQLEEAREEMNQADYELSTFQTENGIIDLTSALEDSQLLLQQLELERSRILFENTDNQPDTITHIELLIKQRRDELEPLLDKRSIHTQLVSDVTLADESYQTVLEQFLRIDMGDSSNAAKELEAAEQETDSALKNAKSALTRFLLNNDIVALESEISMLQNQIEQLGLERDRQTLAVDNQLAHQAAMIASVSNLIAEREAEIESLRALAPRFNLLRMNVEQARDRYELVVGKYNEADLKADALQTADFLQIVSPAEPPESEAVNAKVLFAVGFAGSIGAAVLLAFFFENRDSTLHTAEQIEAVTQESVLGKIPSTGNHQVISFSEGNSLQEEAYRRLRTNIYAIHGSTPLRTLLVTSAQPKEGKSTIVANLACTIAESGRQVVAVDCDLHHPVLYNIFNLTNEIGLSSVLKQQATLDAALKVTEIPGLHVLGAGPPTSKPAELLGSQVMTDLIEEMRERFDVVLLDTPAITAVADAAMLAPSADGVLLVVSCEKVREEAVQAACQQLAFVDARPIGVVVNRVRLDGNYHYYRHSEKTGRTHESDF